MEIEIIKVQTLDTSEDSTRHFGILLKKIQASIHMLHWYAGNYNVHKILGKLYEELDELFDKLQEEIIGTAKIQGSVFPSFTDNLDIDELNSSIKTPEEVIGYYKKINDLVQETLTSLEFNNYVTTVKSGITNTKEDIITLFNRTNYLLSMVNL